MADASVMGVGDIITFMGAAALVYAIIAAACSSPQTAEINAHKRSATLMKWVKIGLAQAALFVLVAIAFAKSKGEAVAAVCGGALAGGVMWASYVYANKSGLASGAPGTESY